MRTEIFVCIVLALSLVSADSFPQDPRERLKFGNEFLLGFSHKVNIPIQSENLIQCKDSIYRVYKDFSEGVLSIQVNHTSQIQQAMNRIASALQNVSEAMKNCTSTARATARELRDDVKNVTHYLYLGLHVLFNYENIQQGYNTILQKFQSNITPRQKGEVLADFFNNLFPFDQQVIVFINSIRSQNLTLPPQQIKRISMCIKGMKKLAQSAKQTYDQFKNRTITDVGVMISRASQILIGLPTSGRICYYAFKDRQGDQTKSETLMLASPESLPETCQFATISYALELESAISKIDTNELTAQDTNNVMNKAAKVMELCANEQTLVQE